MKLGIGKLYRKELEQYCLRYLPLANKEVSYNLDYAFDPARQDLVIATDPVIGVPLGYYGYFAVQYSAGDVACSGVRPRYLNLGIYMPPGTETQWLETTSRDIGVEARRHNIRILGGHTGVYPGLTTPLISTTCVGISDENRYNPQSIVAGDHIYLLGQYGYEFAWVVSHLPPSTLLPYTDFDPKLYQRNLTPMDIVTSSKAAWKSGATFLHDITEGGLSAALLDIAEQAHLVPQVYTEEIKWDTSFQYLVKKIHGDLYSTSSFGSLIAIVSSGNTKDFESRIKDHQIPYACVGSFEKNGVPRYIEKTQQRRIIRGIDGYTRLAEIMNKEDTQT